MLGECALKKQVLVAQLTLSDPMDCSPPGSSFMGFYQIRLMTGEKRARVKARGSECRVCSEKSQLVLGLRIHVPKL